MNPEKTPPVWSTSTLGDLTERFLSGGTPSTSIPEYWNGSIPWITGADAEQKITTTARQFVTDEGVRNSSTSVVPRGNILLVTRTGVGKVSIAGVDVAISQDLTGIIPKEESVDAEYLYWQLKHQAPERMRLAQGTIILGIQREKVRALSVPTPPLPEQRKIAHILTTVDDLIDHTEALIAKLRAIKQGLMHDLLTRGVDEHGQLRPPREEAPEVYKESEVGWVPREWDVVELRDLCSSPLRDFGSFSTTNLIVFLEEGIPFIKSEMIEEGSINWNTVSFISSEVHQMLSKSHVQEGTILLSKIGSALGKAAIYDGRFEVCNSNAAVAKIEIDEQRANRLFVCYFLNHGIAQAQMKNMIISLLPRINLGDLSKLRMRQPSLCEQEIIALRLHAVDETIRCKRANLAKLQSLKKGLMQDLLSGKVRVTVD